MDRIIVTKGVNGIGKTVTGNVIEWKDSFLDEPDFIQDKIIYNKEDMPLYRAAFLVDNGAKAVLMAEGGKNYHPLILLSDSQTPAIAGIGKVDLHGKTVTIDSGKGIVYEGEKKLQKEHEEIFVPETESKVYVNVGYPTAIESAAKTGADGIGLLRIEFTAAKTLSRILDKQLEIGITVKESIARSNEADVIYAMAKHKDLGKYLKTDLESVILEAMKYFREKEIIIRTLDIAREANDPMGNRGIRRCIAEGKDTIRLLAEAIKKSLEDKSAHYKIGVLIPLVSHYSQIKATLDVLLDAGLKLKRNNPHDKMGILYGWEIEQPAASANNELWLEAFKAEYGCSPDYIGIGTNDLTQFTMALGRDVFAKERSPEVRKYLEGLYDEADFSVIKQIFDASKQCKRYETRLFLLGQAAASPDYALLMRSFGIIPSVGIESVRKIKASLGKYEKQYNLNDVIEKYVARICKQYPYKVRNSLKSRLLHIFELN